MYSLYNQFRAPVCECNCQLRNKKLSPNRFHGLILGTAFTVAAIIGTNAIVLKELRRDALEDVQNDLLRQSLTLSELAERTIQSVDLVLESVADKIRVDASANADLKKLTDKPFYLFVERKDVRIAANRHARLRRREGHQDKPLT